jgi:hypothetical protein
LRYIKNGDLLGSISDQWSNEATAALETLKVKQPEERAEFINKNYPIWSSLKSAMATLSHDKCWYSEKRIAVSELEVDHFRPKNRVTDVQPPHAGYWWLAFDWRNYRLAYSLINKRRKDTREGDIQGKGCHFPLVNPESRVPDLAPASVALERPKLIEPCVAADVLLLDYAVEDGKVVERHRPNEADSTPYDRARSSIELFHLNEGTLIRDRHDLFVAIEHSAKCIEELEAERGAAGVLSEKQALEFDGHINQIADRINASAPFSSFARACLRQKGDLGWNTELLATA